MEDIDIKRKLIASRLRTARENSGLSQGQAAKLLGIHRPTLSEMEAGRRKVAAEEIAVLAELYGVDIEWLVDANPKANDSQQEKIKMAARELGKLNKEDFNRLLNLLKTLRD